MSGCGQLSATLWPQEQPAGVSSSGVRLSGLGKGCGAEELLRGEQERRLIWLETSAEVGNAGIWSWERKCSKAQW